MTEAVTELLVGGAIILVFIVLAERIWQPYRRRYIDPAPPPSSDPVAQLADIGGTIGGGCVVFSLLGVLGLCACWALNTALDVIR